MTVSIPYTFATATSPIPLSELDTNFTTVANAINNISSATFIISGLRAVTTTSYPGTNAVVSGYYAAGDGGGGQFVYVSTDTTSSDNGGTIIVDASGRRWYRVWDAATGASIKWFGAKVDGSTDDTAAIQNTINAVSTSTTAGIVLFPPGVTKISATITISYPVTLRGVGMGVGPGTQENASMIIAAASFSTGIMFQATLLGGVTFESLQFNSLTAPRTSGQAIFISGVNPNVNGNSRIINCAFLNQYDCIYLYGITNCLVQGCYFLAWANSAYETDAFSGVESSGGWVTQCFFFGNIGGTAQPYAILLSSGYTQIYNNWFIGAQTGISVAAKLGVPNAAVFITENVMEENTIKSISISQSNTTEVSVVITDNEFSNITQISSFQAHISINAGSSNWITDVNISNNTFNSFFTLGSSSYINLQAGQNVTVNNNTINNNSSGSALGIVAGNQLTAPSSFLDNSMIGFTSGNQYLISAVTPVVRDLTTNLPYSSLGSWANGSQILVSNGHAPNVGSFNFTVTAGGSGCIAWRMQGQWLTIIS